MNWDTYKFSSHSLAAAQTFKKTRFLDDSRGKNRSPLPLRHFLIYCRSLISGIEKHLTKPHEVV